MFQWRVFGRLNPANIKQVVVHSGVIETELGREASRTKAVAIIAALVAVRLVEVV